ncbi:MAG: hypothetical protein H7246_07105 [Phycisphaerae bacterium]|nr:hypothetical protein [Saprospiraceae bacterium]
MENPNYKIDEIFRQRLHDAEVPPPPFVWPAVEQGLQKRRRRLMFIWLFAFGTVAATTWLWQSSLRGDPEDSLQTVAPVAKLPNNVQETNQPVLSESSETKLSETNPDVSASSSSSRAFSSTRSKDKETILTDRATEVQPGTKGFTSNIPSKENLLSEPSSEPKVNVEQTKSLANANTDGFQPIEKKDAFVSNNTLETKGLKSVVSLSNSKRAIAPKSFKSRSRVKKAQPKLCYDFARHPSAWLVDVYGGPSLAQRSLTSRLDDEPYLNQRLATERRSVAMNAGIRASLMFNSNFLVRTGLHYDQVTEVFEHIDPTTVIYTLKFTPGNPIPDTLGVEYGENYLKTYNRYGMLDVPLMVGVEMRQGRSGFSINAGVSANVLFQKRGAIIDPITHEPARFGPISDDPKATGPKTSLSQDVFRTNVGLSATASIQWYWHLSPHFRLFVEPSFRQVLRPVTLSSHPVEQRYSILGLRLGATKIF